MIKRYVYCYGRFVELRDGDKYKNSRRNNVARREKILARPGIPYSTFGLLLSTHKQV